MGIDPREGLKTLLEQHHDPAQAPAAPAEQLPLLAGDQAEAVAVAEVERVGPGRRPGSRNRRSAEWADLILATEGSPLQALAREMKAGPEALARKLGVDLVQGWDRWLKVCEAILPYVHQKLPQALAVTDDRATPPVLLHVSDVGAQLVGTDPGQAAGLVRIVLHQGVSEGGDAKSNGEGSNDAP